MLSGQFLISLCLAALFGRHFTLGVQNTVTIEFSSLTLTSWNESNLTQVFQHSVSTVANGYCASRVLECSLKTWDSTKMFSSGNVMVEGFPQTNGPDLYVKFYMTYPAGVNFSGESRVILAASTVREIVLNSKDNISQAVGKSIKSVSNDVDGDDGDNDNDDGKEGRHSANRMNYIMIPLSVTILIILCLMTCCLQHLKRKRVKQLEAQRMRQLKLKKTNKRKPADVEERVGNTSGPRRKKRVKRKKKKEMQDKEMGSSDDAAPRHTRRTNGTSVWFEDETLEVSPHTHSEEKEVQYTRETEELRTRLKDSVDGQQSDTRENLDTDDVDNDQQQKSKRKRKKKHRKRAHRVDDGGYQGGGQLGVTMDDGGYQGGGQPGVMMVADSQLIKLPSIKNLPPLKERHTLEA